MIYTIYWAPISRRTLTRYPGQFVVASQGDTVPVLHEPIPFPEQQELGSPLAVQLLLPE